MLWDFIREFPWDKLAVYALPTFAFLPLVWILEARLPARPEQARLSVGFLHDAVWAAAYPVFKFCLFNFWVAFLASVVRERLPFLCSNVLVDLSPLARIVAIMLVADFLAWLHHRVRHKLPCLWELHKLHHSQRELNYLSDSRVHPLDWAAAQVIQFIPYFALSLDEALPTYLAWELLKAVHLRLCHANLRTDFGPLRFLFVTPQSHRIHHSPEPAHVDKNFGVMFSVWDYLFGTAYTRYDEYPATGINDPAFPLERSARITSLLQTPLQQLLYPIVTVLRYGFQRRRSVKPELSN